MILFDYFVTAVDGGCITIEKLSYRANLYGVAMTDGDKAYPTLAAYLDKAGVDDGDISEAIQELESTPHGAKTVKVDNYIITQL